MYPRIVGVVFTAPDIGRRIAAARKARGLTQVQLAERLDVNHRSVSRWETGRRLPTDLPKVAAALETTTAALIGVSS